MASLETRAIYPNGGEAGDLSKEHTLLYECGVRPGHERWALGHWLDKTSEILGIQLNQVFPHAITLWGALAISKGSYFVVQPRINSLRG